MPRRIRRQQTIIEIFQNQPIESQEELRIVLHARGIEVTQATLSRDLRELGAIKSPRGYQLPDHTNSTQASVLDHSSGGGSLGRVLASFLLRVQPAGNMVVLKTGPGHAQIVALEIDRTGVPGIVGCLAGDDTIFVATESPDRACELSQELASRGKLEVTQVQP